MHIPEDLLDDMPADMAAWVREHLNQMVLLFNLAFLNGRQAELDAPKGGDDAS